MRYAIFSDIHDNAAALKAVLAHAHSQRIDAWFCLGDVGGDPCVDLVRETGAASVFGNWEAANWRYLTGDNKQWALNLPPTLKESQFWLTHAAPFWPPAIKTLADLKAERHRTLNGNLFPYLHYEEDSLWKAIAMLTENQVPLLFHGHTHRQIIWNFTADNRLQRLQMKVAPLTPGETYVVGVGSVGHPLDGPGAAYLVYDDSAQVLELQRVVDYPL
jgi:predicted phosphodiesterase